MPIHNAVGDDKLRSKVGSPQSHFHERLKFSFRYQLPYEMQVISTLVSDFERILDDDRWELWCLLRDLRRPKWQRCHYYLTVLQLILDRYRDRQIHDLMREVIALKNPEDWKTWVHTADRGGLELRRWFDEYAERESQKYEQYKKKGYCELITDKSFEDCVARLWLGERKTQNTRDRLLKCD